MRQTVAVVSNSFPPYRIHLHQRIAREVPEVKLYSLATHANSMGRWQTSRVPEEICPVNFGTGEPTSEQTHIRHSWREWRKARRIIQWLRDHNVAVVFCQGHGDVGRLRIMRWCRRQGIPVWLTGDNNVHGDVQTGLQRMIKRAVVRYAVACTDGVMPCGIHGSTFFQRYGAQPERIIHWPFCPDHTLFENPPPALVIETRKKWKLWPDRRRLVYSARMLAHKRPDLLLQAFLRIAPERTNWDLVMIGDGPLRKELHALIPDGMQDRVTWTGFLEDTAELAAVYSNCDVFVLPSDKEPWGVVVVEAAASGLAIVVSDVVGAAPELVQVGRNGACFRAGDLDSLCSKLLTVTEPANVMAYPGQSRAVFNEWFSANDPVLGFRRALVQSGLLPNRAASARLMSDCRQISPTGSPATAAILQQQSENDCGGH